MLFLLDFENWRHHDWNFECHCQYCRFYCVSQNNFSAFSIVILFYVIWIFLKFTILLRSLEILKCFRKTHQNLSIFRYVTSPAVQSSWGHPGEAVTNLDISYLVVFTLQIVCDAILIFGALKKIPNHLVPWLWANAVIIAVFLVSSSSFRLTFITLSRSLGSLIWDILFVFQLTSTVRS